MIKNNNVFLAVGQISMAISILLNHFAKDGALISFLIGFLTGLSIVFNLAFLLFYKKWNSGTT
jgi:hypothetical protein